MNAERDEKKFVGVERELTEQIIGAAIEVHELKAVPRTDSLFFSQCLTYLKMLNLEVGLVLNFGYPTLKEGIRHVLNTPQSRHRTHPSSPCLPTSNPSVFSAAGTCAADSGASDH